MAELSSYPPVTTLLAAYRVPVVTNPGVPGGNGYITAANMAVDVLFGPVVTTPEQYGALRDGSTNDTTAFNAAQAALTAGGVVSMSKGIYKTTITPTKSGVTFRGAGMWATTLIPPAGTGYQIEWSATFASDIAFEDLAFDWSALSTGHCVLLNGVTTRNITFRRCRFYNVPNRPIHAQGLSWLTVEGCLFHTSGNAFRSEGIHFTYGSRHAVIRNNTFLYCYGGVYSNTNCDDVVIDNNYFDQGWWLNVSVATGTGGPVTYTATVLTDTGANFATLTGNGAGYYVRSMATRRTNSGGTVTYTYSQNLLVDTAASFVADGVLKGEIIRVGSIFAVVENVVSATTLQVEEWLSNTTYLPVAQPADGAAYTVYKIVMGFIASGTATTLTVGHWYDLDGTTATPSAGTMYEVINKGQYPVHLDSCSGVKVTNNHLKRGWADQISSFGTECQIIGNTIEDGQDYGITCHGANNIVGFNRVRHQGVVGITCGDSDSTCIGNDVSGCTWTNSTVTASIAGIMIWGANTLVVGNRVDGANRAMSLYGLTVFAFDGTAITGCSINNNHVSGHATSDIFLDRDGTGTISDLRLYSNVGTVGRGAAIAASVGDFRLGVGYIGFNGVTPVAQSTGWAVSNVTTDKVLDANNTTIDELADNFGTLVTYLISIGLLAA